MYSYIEGSIFESPAHTLVNTVNLAGAMGKGLAREYKRLFPDMFCEYQKLCESGKFEIGKLWIYYTANKWILNFPTKKHWRYPAKLEYIEKGLKTFVAKYNSARITSIAFPKLGCGNGELEWKEVKPLMEKYLKSLPIDIYVYEVNTYIVPEHKEVNSMRQWLMSEPYSYSFDDFKCDTLELLKSGSVFTGVEGESFKVFSDKNGLIIHHLNQKSQIPWRINENVNGLRELWQYFRAKGVLTLNDMIIMGFAAPECIMGLLLKLPYIGKFGIRNKNKIHAICLKPYNQIRPLPLFRAIPDRIVPLQR